MNITEIKNIAKERGVKPGKMNKGELIRAIQASEGNSACYGTGQSGSCGQEGCAWRDGCDRP